VNSVCWNREFIKLKLCICEDKPGNSRSWNVTIGLLYLYYSVLIYIFVSLYCTYIFWKTYNKHLFISYYIDNLYWRRGDPSEIIKRKQQFNMRIAVSVWLSLYIINYAKVQHLSRFLSQDWHNFVYIKDGT
jgi:hypothetical protein